MKQKPAILSMRHEAVYHAARWYQAASLSLTPPCLRGVKEACPIERQKTGSCFASKTLSENRNFVKNELSTSQMKKSQIMLDLLLPADQKPTRAIEPRMRALHDP